MHHDIYIGSILLERNRWTQDKAPSIAASEWADRFATAGFDGTELWSYHALHAAPDEQDALIAAFSPVAVLSCYGGFDTDATRRDQECAWAHRLNARAVKFNTGADPDRIDTYRRNLTAWAASLPTGCQLLCECHPNTLAETPAGAATFFAALPDLSVELMVHPFLVPVETLEDWFNRLGDRITHAHVQLRNADDAFCTLREAPEQVQAALAVMRRHGYRGSFTIEFTAGTRTDQDTPDVLWRNAIDDLAFLRGEILTD